MQHKLNAARSLVTTGAYDIKKNTGQGSPYRKDNNLQNSYVCLTTHAVDEAVHGYPVSGKNGSVVETGKLLMQS